MPYWALREGAEMENLQVLPKYVQDTYRFARAWLQKQPYFSLRTSGSTGSPKLLRLQRSQLKISAQIGMDVFKIPAGLPLLLCLSVEHIAGMMQVVRAIEHGHHLHVLEAERYVLKRWKLGRRYGLVSLIPLQLQVLTAPDFEQLLQCHTVLLGGGPLSEPTEAKLRRLPTHIYHSYGMSESAAHVALRRIAPSFSLYFEALPSINLSQMKNGCLQISSPTTNHRPLQTQDLVSMKSRTSFVWLGRSDAIINSGGIKLNINTLEEQVSRLWEQSFGSNAAPAFAYSLPDDTLGQRFVWFSEQRPSNQILSAFIDRLKELPLYHAPRSLCIPKHFATTHSGKLDKKHTATKILQEIPLSKASLQGLCSSNPSNPSESY